MLARICKHRMNLVGSRNVPQDMTKSRHIAHSPCVDKNSKSFIQYRKGKVMNYNIDLVMGFF